MRAPSDKSMSHRAIICAALATGDSRITGLLQSNDVLATLAAMAEFGSEIESEGQGQWRVRGVGIGGFREPSRVIDFGNSGTGVRLTMGAMATTPIQAVFQGDQSLSRRPMRRVLEPLVQMGARVQARDNDLLPVMVRGTDRAIPIVYESPVPSAQVKSAILFAGLNAPGETRVVEKSATRDHTERLLRLFGTTVNAETRGDGTYVACVKGHAELKPCRLTIPGDPSSAAFVAVAALVVPDSEVLINDVLVNPLRVGLYETLVDMGGDIEFINQRYISGEPVADLRVSYSELNGVDVPAERAPSMIDEYPILSVAAAAAHGRTTMKGLAELRFKESDRLSAIFKGLKRSGLDVTVGDDGIAIEGAGPATSRTNARPIPGGSQINTNGDHRIAMSFLTLGLVAQNPIEIDQAHMIETSFPSYSDLMISLGAEIEDIS